MRTLRYRPALSFMLPAVMALLFHACAPEAPNVDLSATGGTVPGSSPGTEFLQVESIYPDAPLPATDRFPIDTDVVIIFSKPIYDVADITPASVDIPGNPGFASVTGFAADGSGYYRAVRIAFTGNLAYSTPYTIEVDPAAIRDSGGLDTGIPGNDTAEFTTGDDDSGDYDPVVIATSRYPVGAGPYSRGVGYVVVSFNKEVQNVTAATFTIAPAAASVAPYFSLDQKTWYLPLNTLTYAQVYTVDLDDTPGTGIRDTGLRDLVVSVNNTWTFTVEADPNPGGPITIGSVWLTEVTQNSVRINWTTTRPATGFTVNYGLTTVYGFTKAEAGTPTVHYADITGLTTATRYYFIIDHATIVTQTGNFMTANDTDPAINDERLNAVAAGPPAANISEFTVHQNTDATAYVAWVDGTSVRATYINATGVPNVNWHPGQLIDNAHGLSDPRLFPDGYGGVFVVLEDGASGFYVKYVTGGATGLGFSTYWSDNTAAGFGNTFGHTAGYQDASAIPMYYRYGAGLDNNVYNGFVTRIHNGTGVGSTHNIPANPFYDFDVNLRNAVIQNDDRIMDVTDHVGAVATRSTNFRHVLGQSAGVVTTGNVYRIADGVTSFTSFLTDDHAMNVTPPTQTSTANRVITEHNYAPPAWMGVGDVIHSGATYVYINSLNGVNMAADYSGAEEPVVLYDPDVDFTALGVAVNDVVVNISAGPPISYARVTDVNTDMLALDADIFPHTGDQYDIYRLIDEGTAEASADSLIDSTNLDDWTALVVPGDWVANINDNTYGQVTVVVSATELTIPGLNFDAGEGYMIVEDPPIVDNGTENAFGANPLVDYTADWSAIAANALVYNLTTPDSAFVSASSTRVLNLSDPIFSLGAENYSIYNNYCTTHAASPVDPFYRILVDLATFNVGDNVTVDVYNYRTITGTADTPPANPLYDDNATFVTTGVVNNDVLVNVTDTSIARVTTGTFAVRERALDINGAAAFMSDADLYWLLRFVTPAETWLKYGKASALSAGLLVSAGAAFDVAGVENGDLVYNISDNRFAVVVSRDSPTQLTLNKNIFDTGNEDYLVFASTEPLVATGTISAVAGNQFTDGDVLTNFQLAAYRVHPGDVVKIVGNNTVGIVQSVDSATQITLRAAIPGWAATQRYYIYRQRLFFAWESGGSILGAVINMGNGSVYSTSTLYTAGDVMDNVKLLHANGDNGGARVIFESNTDGNIYYKRVNSFGTVVLGAAANGGRGLLLYNGTAAEIIDVRAAPDNANFRFLVLYRDGANIYLARYNSATGALADWGTNPISFAGAVDAAITFDTSNNPVVAYADSLGRIYAEKFTAATGVQANFGTLLDVAGTGSYVSNLSIASDGLNGAVVSWMDNRYYYSVGYVIVAQAVIPNAGAWTLNWFDDVADDDGVVVGIVSSWDDDELSLKGLYYNDGGTPYGGLFLWKDYRNATTPTEADIFYDVRANP
ncbi:MAG TPA: hypothetical protein VLM75_13085 [Spirochaetota bacterium]|nr:hypothetical protein [Spirochaetota bacterium]